MSIINQDFPWLDHYPQSIDWRGAIDPHPLYLLVESAAERFPGHACIEFMGREFSFAKIAENVRRLAHALQKLGVEKGTRVGLFMPNCPQFVMFYYAILRAGGTVVNFNPLYPEHDIAHQVEDAGVRIMVTLSLKALYPKLSPLLAQGKLDTIIVSDMEDALPFAKGVIFHVAKASDHAHVPHDAQHPRYAEMIKESDDPALVVIDPLQDVAVLQYTGGTTGKPKGTMLTHANLYCNAIQCGLWFEKLQPGEERLLGVIPLFHVFAMTAVMNLSMHMAATMILHPRFDLKAVLKDIEAKKPTLMPGVPTMFAAMNNYKQVDKYDLTSLRMCISGGAPLPLEIKDQFEKRTNCTLVEGYGLSESSPVVACNPLFGQNKKGSIGLPFPRTMLEVIDLDDPTKILGVGEVGEICIRGPQVMKGYWNQPEETANVIKHGRLHTGDVGYMDKQGYFFIVDRKKEMIITGGYNVYPRNVEEVIYTHDCVLECAVIGVEHGSRGQVVKAFVVCREGSSLSEADLKAFLKDKLAPFAMPHKVEFRDALPKTLIGKISKKELV